MCMTHWCGKRFVLSPGTAALENNRSTADPLIPAKLILKVTAALLFPASAPGLLARAWSFVSADGVAHLVSQAGSDLARLVSHADF